MRGDESLTAAGEDFDEVFVDEETQFDILAGGQVGDGERCLAAADAQSAGLGTQQDGFFRAASSRAMVMRTSTESPGRSAMRWSCGAAIGGTRLPKPVTGCASFTSLSTTGSVR